MNIKQRLKRNREGIAFTIVILTVLPIVSILFLYLVASGFTTLQVLPWIPVITIFIVVYTFFIMWLAIPKKQESYRYIPIAEQIVDLEEKLVSLISSRELVSDDTNKVENIDIRIDDTKRRLKKLQRRQELQKYSAYEYTYTFWVLLLGEPSVGIEELTRYYFYGDSMDYKLTLGVQFYSKKVIVQDYYVKLVICDVSLKERFQLLFPLLLGNKNAAIIMYDLSNSDTLNQIPEWVQLIREMNGNIPIMLIGNNVDLVESRDVSKEEGEMLKEKFNLSAFFEISTKTGENVEEAFEHLTRIIINHYKN
jgi:small GTP-binding protein